MFHMTAKRKALETLRQSADVERDEAVRLARSLRRDLSKLEASLRAADVGQAAAAVDVGRKRTRLQHAALELMGLGIADQRTSRRHNRARFEVLLALTVRHAAASFLADPSLAGVPLPDPNRRPRVPYDDYPPELVSLVSAQLDAMVGLVPDLAAKILPTWSDVEERLVYAASARRQRPDQGQDLDQAERRPAQAGAPSVRLAIGKGTDLSPWATGADEAAVLSVCA